MDDATHNIPLLISLATPFATEFSVWLEAAERLTPYAAAFRYPGEILEPDRAEFNLALEAAEGLYTFVLSVLPDEIHPWRMPGIRGRALIINLPGSPKACRENLETIAPALPHAMQLLSPDFAVTAAVALRRAGRQCNCRSNLRYLAGAENRLSEDPAAEAA